MIPELQINALNTLLDSSSLNDVLVLQFRRLLKHNLKHALNLKMQQ